MRASVRQIINPHPDHQRLLFAALQFDISRRNLAFRGKGSFAGVVEMAEYARREINNIGGYYVLFSRTHQRRQHL